jgi:hypothetical protein
VYDAADEEDAAPTLLHPKARPTDSPPAPAPPPPPAQTAVTQPQFAPVGFPPVQGGAVVPLSGPVSSPSPVAAPTSGREPIPYAMPAGIEQKQRLMAVIVAVVAAITAVIIALIAFANC